MKIGSRIVNIAVSSTDHVTRLFCVSYDGYVYEYDWARRGWMSLGHEIVEPVEIPKVDNRGVKMCCTAGPVA